MGPGVRHQSREQTASQRSFLLHGQSVCSHHHHWSEWAVLYDRFTACLIHFLPSMASSCPLNPPADLIPPKCALMLHKLYKYLANEISASVYITDAHNRCTRKLDNATSDSNDKVNYLYCNKKSSILSKLKTKGLNLTSYSLDIKAKHHNMVRFLSSIFQACQTLRLQLFI